MAFQYGDLRVDQLTYTSGGANQTVTVSGLVQQVTTGGTTSGNVRIEGDLTVTGQINANTITGNTINAVSGNFENISGINLTYENGTISGLVVQDDAAVSGDLGVVGTITGFTISAPTSLFGQVNVITATGTTANFATGNFTNLSGGTITGDTLNITSGTFIHISGGTLVVSGITITGNDGGSINLPDTVTGVSGLFTFLSGNTVTGNTVQGTTGQFIEVDTTDLFADNITVSANAVITGDVTATNITGTTITGTTVNATTGNFQVLEGPVATTSITGIARIATSEEAASAVGPSGTYTDTISGNANSAFAINPSGLSSAIRAYDPPVGDSAGTKIYVRTVTTTGIAPDFAISGVTWSGITGLDVDPVNDEQATSAVRPSGTYGAVPSGTATSEFFYNPVQLEKTFKAYDPAATAAEEQLYARVVSGVSDGQGGFNTTSHGWIRVPQGTASIATEPQAQAAAGASGTYSETPTAADVANFINPNRLRSALQSYDPGIVSGERRVYARVVSGVTDTEGDYEWLNVTDAVAGDFLPLSGGTVAGYTNFEAGLGISGNVQITGNITQTGNHTTSGTYNASRNSNSNQVLYQVNNSAGRGMYQGDHAGVAFAKGGSGVAEFTVTGDQTFGVISGDLRVGGDAQNVSDVNSSQFWALSGGQFVSAFSTNESIVWKDAAQGDILKLQSNVGSQRSDKFIFTASGDLTVTGTILARTGEFLEIDAFEENNGLIRSFSGDFHDLVIGDPAIYGAFLENPALQVIGSGIFHSGVFFTANNVPSPLALYATATGTNAPNIVIGSSGLLGGASTRNSIAIGRLALENASSDSDRNIAIGNSSMTDMTDGEKNVALGHGAMQNIRPGLNQGFNTALGDQAMLGNGNASNSCRENVAVGANALDAVLNARENVAVGRNAMTVATTVTGNTAVGFEAMDAHQDGNFNTALGWNAGGSFTNASGNVCLGASAGANINGSNNTIIGRVEAAAGFSNTIILGAGLTEKVRVANNEFTITPVDGSAAILKTSGLTADRTYTFPNQAGTIALTSDIPGGDDNLTLHNLSVVNDDDIQVARISGDDGGSAMFASGFIQLNSQANVEVAKFSNNVGGVGGRAVITLSGRNLPNEGLQFSSNANSNNSLGLGSGYAQIVNKDSNGLGIGVDDQAIAVFLTSGIRITQDTDITETMTFLDRDGSASFSSGITTIGADSVSGSVRVGNNFGNASAAPNARVVIAGSSTEGIQFQDNNQVTTAKISWDGSATFSSGRITLDADGDIDFADTASGQAYFAEQTSSAGQLWKGSNNGNETSVIRADGTATFVSGRTQIRQVGPSNSALVQVRQEGDTNAAFAVLQGGDTVNNHSTIQLLGNGSASFASGRIDLFDNGRLSISGGGITNPNTFLFRALSDQNTVGSQKAVLFSDGEFRLGTDTSADATTQIQLNGADGSVSLASGNFTIAGNGLVTSSGRLTARRATNTDAGVQIQNSAGDNIHSFFGDGSATLASGLITLNANASADFAGRVTSTADDDFMTRILPSGGIFMKCDGGANPLQVRDSSNNNVAVIAVDGAITTSGQYRSTGGFALDARGNFTGGGNTAAVISNNGSAAFVSGAISLNGTDGTETVFNEKSRDCDFRVESDGNANMLFVDAGNDRVGVGTSAPGATLDVSGNAQFTGNMFVRGGNTTRITLSGADGAANFADGKVSIAASGVITASGYLLTNLPVLP